MFDATFLAQPVIRAIDGHLKNVISNNIPSATSEDIRMNGYHYFEKIGEERYTLDAAYIPEGMSDELKRYIGNCYSFFHRNRNVLSHWDDPTTTIDTTKLLDVHSAHDLIKRTLTLIDKYYEIV
jgi:ribonuclease HI